MGEPVDLLIVGGGVIGLASAWRAAQRGLTVRVVERDRPGAGASTAAAGILAPTETQEWEGARGAFNLAAMDGWERFAEELDADVGFRRDGALRIARDEAERAELEAASRALTAAGVEHELLDAAACVAEEPGVRGAAAGLLAPRDAHVATDRLVAALAAACARAGVRVTSGVEPVAAISGRAGAIAGVSLSDDTDQPAGLTVLAAGAWSSQAEWLPAEARPPVRPRIGEYVLLRGDEDRPVCHRVIRPVGGSIARRDHGRYWVGTTVRDAGYASLPQAGAVQRVLTDAIAVLPALAGLGVERAGAGLRPATPDGLPIVGPSVVPGLAIATGHGREGIIQAPLTALAVAALAAGAPLPGLYAPFSPQRPALRSAVP